MAYIRYANQGATRNQPLSEDLAERLRFLEEMGLTAEVFSGGQPSEGPGRVGSHRHDHGNSGDVRFFQGDRQLNWANEADLPIFQDIVRKGKAAGITGFGAGPGYMGEGTMHIGMGAPAVWGAGGKGDNAPNWLREAYGMSLNTPNMDAPREVASRPIAAVSDAAASQLPAGVQPVASAAAPANTGLLGGLTGIPDKIGQTLFGDKAKDMKAAVDDPKSNLAKGLGLMAQGSGATAKRAIDDPIQSLLPAMEAGDAARMQAAQQLMASLIANRRNRGMTLTGGFA